MQFVISTKIDLISKKKKLNPRMESSVADLVSTTNGSSHGAMVPLALSTALCLCDTLHVGMNLQIGGQGIGLLFVLAEHK